MKKCSLMASVIPPETPRDHPETSETVAFSLRGPQSIDLHTVQDVADHVSDVLLAPCSQLIPGNEVNQAPEAGWDLPAMLGIFFLGLSGFLIPF